MPQKACERCIFQVRPYAYLFEMPQNRRLSFSTYFSFSNFLKRPIFPISKKKHVTSLKMKNKSKMKVFDFEAFQINMHMASREKNIFHMLFGAFHITLRNSNINE